MSDAQDPRATTPVGNTGQPPGGRPPGGDTAPTEVAESFTRELRDGNLDRAMPFSEFMFQLGMAYDLPGRQQEALAIAERKRRTRRWLVALAVVTVVGGGAAQLMGRTPSEATLPVEVLGQWATLYPQYAGRAFTLTEDRIDLDFGELAARVAFPVSEVRRNTVADTSVFEVLYEQERGLTRFEFIYVEGAVPTIYLPHPRGVAWVRVQDLALLGEGPARLAVPEAAVARDDEAVVRKR